MRSFLRSQLRCEIVRQLNTVPPLLRMTEPRPSLKIKLNTGPPRPPLEAQATPTSAMPKLKLKFGSKPTDAQQPPAPPPPPLAVKPKVQRKPKEKKDKPARISNPTPKKRALEESTISDGDEEPHVDSPQPPLKKRFTIKLNTKAPHTSAPPSAPLPSGIRHIKITGVKGKKLKELRPKGVGYDSEAEDQESDPAIEDDFILRMQPGEDCEYLRQAVAEQRFGPKAQGGADVKIRFLRNDGRRALVLIKGKMYAASMVDLPCIVEGMKSWDKRAWYKSVDICQMLLVLGVVKTEEEAMNYPLPKHDVNEKTMQYAHGLTPPMRLVRKRRFRKRINRAAIEDVEREVERLFADDANAKSSRWSFVDERQLERERAQRQREAEQAEMGMANDEDAEGDYDDQEEYGEDLDSRAQFEEEQDDLAAEVELAMLGGHDELEAGTPTETLAETPVILTDTNAPSPMSFAAETPMAADSPAATISKAGTSGDEQESSDEDAGSVDDVDEDEVEQQQDLMRQKEAIEDLQAAIKSQEAEMERQSNLIFKKKLAAKIQSLKADLESKMSAMGESAEE